MYQSLKTATTDRISIYCTKIGWEVVGSTCRWYDQAIRWASEQSLAKLHLAKPCDNYTSTFGRRAFSVEGPKEWNSLTHSLGPCLEYRRLQIGAENSSFCGTKGRLAHERHCGIRYTNQLLPLLLLLLLTQFSSFRRQSWQPITRLMRAKLNNVGKYKTRYNSENRNNWKNIVI